MLLVALWQLAWLLLSLASFSWPWVPPPTPTQNINRHWRQSQRMHTNTHIASVSRFRLSEVKASRAMWDVVTLYLITFSQAVMNVATVLSTKTKTCLKHTVGTQNPHIPLTHAHCHIHWETHELRRVFCCFYISCYRVIFLQGRF